MSTGNSTNNAGNNKTSAVIGIVAFIIVFVIAFASCGGDSSSGGYDVRDDPDYDRVYNYYKYGTWG